MTNNCQITITLSDAKATKHLGRLLGQSLPAGSVVLLEGDLGAGKTTLVQGIGEGLGIEDPIVSPTFTLVNEYTEGRLPLYHLDLYRLQTKEIESLYLDTYWEGIEVLPGITAIEWGQRLSYQPSNYLKIHLVQTPNQSRQAQFLLVGQLKFDLLHLLSNWTQ